MDQCDKQKSAIGDHDVFEYSMDNRTPQELTPYVFNLEVRGRDAQEPLLPSSSSCQGLAPRNTQVLSPDIDEFVVGSLCSPIGVMPRQGRSRLGNERRGVAHSQVAVPVSPPIQKEL